MFVLKLSGIQMKLQNLCENSIIIIYLMIMIIVRLELNKIKATNNIVEYCLHIHILYRGGEGKIRIEEETGFFNFLKSFCPLKLFL